MDAALYLKPAVLPWTYPKEEKSLFRKVYLSIFAIVLLFSLIIPAIDVPKPERKQLEELPPQLAKIVLEKKQLPPPPKPKPKPKPKEPEKPKEVKKEPPKQKEVKKQPEPIKPQNTEQARKKAATSGLLAFKDDLMDMRETVDVNKLSNTKNLARGDATAKKLERAIISSNAGKTSGGISTSQLSRNTGGTALSSRETTTVSAPVEVAQAPAKVSGNGSGAPSRNIEDIRSVFDQNKGAIYALYNRELRKDPTLQGKVILEIIIEADGAVSDVRIVSSELDNPQLESRLIARVKLFNFGSRRVSRTTINYPIDFLPS